MLDGARAGAARRQDRRLRAGLRRDGEGLARRGAGTCRSAPIAKIWRAGCIIRSVFLDDIAKAYATSGTVANLMMIEPFTGMLKATNGSLRLVVAAAALKGIPVPALSSALAYFDMIAHGAHHRQPHPGAARLLRRARLRAHRRAGQGSARARGRWDRCKLGIRILKVADSLVNTARR